MNGRFYPMSMKQYISYIIVWVLALGMSGKMAAQTSADTAGTVQNAAPAEQDSVDISLITCSPGTELYQLYGHTALRVREVRQGRRSDWVFNYGTFSFKQKNFMWRFMLGETDYELSVLPYGYFYEEYVREGRAIYEQRLNLTPAEEKALVDALTQNLQPENAVYRYNFFYDNCTTRALRIVAQHVNGKVKWPQGETNKSLRDIVHEYAQNDPWICFGQDLVLGAEADRPADIHAQMFAPLYAQRYVTEARIVGADGKERFMAAPSLTLLPAVPMSSETTAFTPLVVFSLLLTLVVALTIYEWIKKKYVWQIDALLQFVQGFVGCLVAFLFFFSAHPAVGSNCLLALFNPLPLLFLPWFMKYATNHRRFAGQYVQGLMLAVALLLGLCGLQHYPAEVYLIIAALAVRVVAHFKFVKP